MTHAMPTHVIGRNFKFYLFVGIWLFVLTLCPLVGCKGEVFAAEGYAKVTGDVGVCIATSGPGATNLVTGLADALLDSVPLVAITGQVPRRMIGTDAFQETPIVEVTRQITKHNYLVMVSPHTCNPYSVYSHQLIGFTRTIQNLLLYFENCLFFGACN
jgi:hypothetical protein